jgi:hypothetical protein
LAGDLGFIAEDELGKIISDMAEIERMIEALMKSLERNLDPLNL